MLPKCRFCNRPKAPLGRDVPAAAHADYCQFQTCHGYDDAPRPTDLWPGEEHDWQGRPAPKPTYASERITVWEIEATPSPFNGYDTMIERSWQIVSGMTLETFLDGLDEAEAREGVTIKVRLVDMFAEDIPNAD